MQQKICRICMEDENEDKMITPCLCAGTCKWVHRYCLDKWRVSEYGTNVFNQCPQCKFYYVFRYKSESWVHYIKIIILLLCLLLYVVTVIGVFVGSLNIMWLVLYTDKDICTSTFTKNMPKTIFSISCVAGIYVLFEYFLVERIKHFDYTFDTCVNLHIEFLFFLPLIPLIGFYVMLWTIVHNTYVSGMALWQEFQKDILVKNYIVI